jgi:hypothetical protein
MREVETEVASLRAEMESVKVNLLQTQRMAIDHEQRFDTLQTWWWKRVWYWLAGWPWHDLNADRKQWRPWNCEKCRRREKRLLAAVTRRPCEGCDGDQALP